MFDEYAIFYGAHKLPPKSEGYFLVLELPTGISEAIRVTLCYHTRISSYKNLYNLHLFRYFDIYWYLKFGVNILWQNLWSKTSKICD
jgi:hypothetical protein